MNPAHAALDTAGDQRRLIPFDYQFQFALTGRGRVLRQSVAVSIEAEFMAVSIGYGLAPTARAVTFGPRLSDFPGPIDSSLNPSLGQIPLSVVLAAAERALAQQPGGDGAPASETAFRAGIQLNPDVAELALQDSALDERTMTRLFRVAGAASNEVQFLYALFDEGTGRAFQSDPLLNIAGLGASNGRRPFRHFSPPIRFEPRTTIGLEITEIDNFIGTLYVTLQGYKVLGATGTPTATVRRTGRRR